MTYENIESFLSENDYKLDDVCWVESSNKIMNIYTTTGKILKLSPYNETCKKQAKEIRFKVKKLIEDFFVTNKREINEKVNNTLYISNGIRYSVEYSSSFIKLSLFIKQQKKTINVTAEEFIKSIKRNEDFEKIVMNFICKKFIEELKTSGELKRFFINEKVLSFVDEIEAELKEIYNDNIKIEYNYVHILVDGVFYKSDIKISDYIKTKEFNFEFKKVSRFSMPIGITFDENLFKEKAHIISDEIETCHVVVENCDKVQLIMRLKKLMKNWNVYIQESII